MPPIRPHPISLRSVNGAAVTVIDGEDAARCVYLTNGALLAGLSMLANDTLHPGSTGGGVRCESAGASLSDCVLTGNWSTGLGGGARSGTLYNCTLTGNSAAWGGRAVTGTLNNCALNAITRPTKTEGRASAH